MPSERLKTGATTCPAMESPTTSSVPTAVATAVPTAVAPTAVSPSRMHSCRAGEADQKQDGNAKNQ
jgi:hypothetical protein